MRRLAGAVAKGSSAVIRVRTAGAVAKGSSALGLRNHHVRQARQTRANGLGSTLVPRLQRKRDTENQHGRGLHAQQAEEQAGGDGL